MLRRATRQFNIRLPREVRSTLSRLAGKRGASASAVAVQALMEWTREQEHPAVDFRWTPSGRLPHATGTGLSVWEIEQLWKAHDESFQALRKHYPHLTNAQVQAAVSYARAYPSEQPEDAFGIRPPFAVEVRI